MILYFYSIILGIIQGLTEFLPVSSSGHLILFHQFLIFDLADNLTFDVALHLGSLLALIIFFRSDLAKYIKAFLKKIDSHDSEQKIAYFILIASLPAAISGFFFESVIEKFFSSLISVAMALIIGGILFIIFEKISSQKDSLENLNFKSAMIIGFSQVCALIPGVSRSGITIIAGLGRNLNREAAARFSFLLAVPIIFGAGIKKVFDFSFASLSFSQRMIFILGFLSAFISSYFCVKYFLKYLKNHSLIPFAIYRFILAGIIIIYIFK
ncbi:MAG: undecaprenyl-diphosphatase [Parcubacteria group bacterium Athens1014_10]|nr:MAG: undecaprenyl-diphosphatase [Parcubacteria group bacterium Athens1014_10]TSD05995.1 MAG: undecaprenyl-diphosphatase [Parcubacteria group bacterium Athens0714_12]